MRVVLPVGWGGGAAAGAGGFLLSLTTPIAMRMASEGQWPYQQGTAAVLARPTCEIYYCTISLNFMLKVSIFITNRHL
jgi:hypothetical protein